MFINPLVKPARKGYDTQAGTETEHSKENEMLLTTDSEQPVHPSHEEYKGPWQDEPMGFCGKCGGAMNEAYIPDSMAEPCVEDPTRE